MGYGNVFCFKGGIPEWRSFSYPMQVNEYYSGIKVKKISPGELSALIKSDRSLYILDVRPLACDRENIFIKGATVCPMVYLADWYANLPANRKIVITDWTNKKSILAAKFLISKGYPVIGILKGGIVRWHSEKLPVVHIDQPYITTPPDFCKE